MRLLPDLRKHEAVVVELGVDGMSSDETDAKADGNHVLSIKAKKWHNRILTRWLHDLDIIYMACQVTIGGTVERGNWAHQCRFVQGKFFYGATVHCLPKSFYHASFLASLSDEQCEELEIIDQSYDLTHTSKLVQ